jgi:hypothetical protein
MTQFAVSQGMDARAASSSTFEFSWTPLGWIQVAVSTATFRRTVRRGSKCVDFRSEWLESLPLEIDNRDELREHFAQDST